ncbi:serine/threonine-protein kinase PLK4-like [Centruroides sculpturatus]|uniref:serine/threonine-protein kinase PLK4-like n=1 Tax=Centruroides sculpturatus TaxID=218467 RepID=UPI000C6EBE74|nr:serine/threonine-protein kinase PLK4-like [Centruroides sculpturatus]
MSLPGEYANKQKEKADRDVSFCKPRVLSVRDKNIVGPESPSSLNAFGGIESDPVIFSTRVPQIGHFYTLKSKAVLVKFNDGSRLLLPKDGFPLDYVDLSGKCKRYFQNSQLPSHLMEKLAQAQTVIAESQKDRKKQRTTGIT